MNFFLILLTVAGLALFEIIGSIDNAIINVRVLKTMHKRARQLFLVFGLFFGVFVVRGILPWLIVWLSTPGIGFWHAFTAAFSSDPSVRLAIESSSKFLLAGTGTFLLLIFLRWLFYEPKKYAFALERCFKLSRSLAFVLIALILAVLTALSFRYHSALALSTLIGAALFILMTLVRKIAEQHHEKILNYNISDLGKLFYLEIIDASFSMDSVLGAFAFTFNIPLILLGNGIGALVVRQLTIKNVKSINHYPYLINGAMYSIGFLGLLMLIKSFGLEVPPYLAPCATFIIVSYFIYKSRKEY